MTTNTNSSRASFKRLDAPPVDGNPAGWPRPRAMALTSLAGRPLGVMPMPWIADHEPEFGFLATKLEPRRVTYALRLDLCQVCGGPRGPEVFGLLGHERPELAHHAGGAVCSLRCARLSAAMCPYYRGLWPVSIYAVPRTEHGRARLEIDEQIHLPRRGRCVSVLGRPA